MLTSILLATLAAFAGTAAADADSWPGFRGDGSSNSSASLPLHWSPTKGIAWSVDLPGYGQSSPVVWKDRVYVTAVEGDQKDRYLVACYNLSDGKQRWKREFAASQKWKSGPLVSRAAPTPIADAQGVYAFLEGGVLSALSPDGDVRWERSLVKDFGPFENKFGLGSSLIASEDSLFVLIDHEGPSYLLSVDKATGKDRWKSERTPRAAWTSPSIGTILGRLTVVVSSLGSVDGYDAADGKLLWRKEDIIGNNLASPAIHGDLVVVGASESKTVKDVAGATRSNCCLKIVEKDGKFEVEVLWNAKKAMATMSSPIAHQGMAYFVNKAGVVFGLDLATGEEKFAERLDSVPWATPVAVGKHVFFFAKDGVTTVLGSGPTFGKVATNSLWPLDAEKRKEGEIAGPYFNNMDPLVYGVAAVEGRWIVRTGTKLYCIAK